MAWLTTGVEALDDLLAGVRVGDNLVLRSTDGRLLQAAARTFEQAQGSVVRVTTGADDASVGSGTVLRWAGAETPASVDQARSEVEYADERVGTEAAFVFDSLDGIRDLWGEDAALDLFLHTCPRLFRRRSLALWLVDPDAFAPRFLSRLEAITQVVLDLVPEPDGTLTAEVVVAQGRPPDTVGGQIRLSLNDHGFAAIGEPVSGRPRVGEMIRTLRQSRGLTQAELARRIGVTPSALSQVERGVRGLSGERLVSVWEELGVPFGPQTTDARGYRVLRRGSAAAEIDVSGASGHRVAEDDSTGEVWLLDFAPGSTGRGSLFTVKRPETVVVLQGVLDIQVEGRAETLQEGDALTTRDAVPDGWHNPASTTTRVVWILGP